jgi:hypothetical protein
LIVPQPAEARSCRCSHGPIFCSLTPFWGRLAHHAITRVP